MCKLQLLLCSGILATSITVNAFADCSGQCVEMSSECNTECPMDAEGAAGCHFACQALYSSCEKKCSSNSKEILVDKDAPSED